MEEHNRAHKARKHEKVQNHSLASMSTIVIVVFCKTKNVIPQLGKKGPLLDMYLVETVSCLLKSLDLSKRFVNTENVSP